MRGSTPTQTFEISFDTRLLTELNIYYSQNDELLLTKTMKDCELDGNKIIVNLSREETLSFDDNFPLQVQLDLNVGDKWIPTEIKYLRVNKFLGGDEI